MGVYLYCIGAADHPEPADVVGVDGSGVRGEALGEFVVWISELERAPTATLERIREHNRVVEAATASRTPLPSRFGQWFAAEAELEAILDERRERLVGALDRVRDAVEFGVRVEARDAPPPSTPDRSTGTAYLESLARRERATAAAHRQGEEVAAELRAHLGPLVREQRLGSGGGRGLVAIAHLVARHDTGNYRDRLRTFPARHPMLRFIESGPWPPYGFSDDAS